MSELGRVDSALRCDCLVCLCSCYDIIIHNNMFPKNEERGDPRSETSEDDG